MGKSAKQKKQAETTIDSAKPKTAKQETAKAETVKQETVQNDLESLLPSETGTKPSTDTQLKTQKGVAALELSALRAKAAEFQQSVQKADKAERTQANMRLPMRDALIMLDRDIPRAINVITTKHTAYPYGYLKDGDAFGAFLQSPSLIALLRCARTTELDSLPLTQKLPELAVPRTAYILSAIAEQLSAKGYKVAPQAQDRIAGETQAQTAYRINLMIEDYLTALAPDNMLTVMMEQMA